MENRHLPSDTLAAMLGNMAASNRTRWAIRMPPEAKNGPHKLPRVAGSWARWALKTCQFNACFFLGGVSGTIRLLGDPPFMVNPPNMGVFGRCIARRVTLSKHVDICLNKSKHLWYFMMKFHDSWGEWGFKPPKHGNVGKSRTEAWLHR